MNLCSDRALKSEPSLHPADPEPARPKDPRDAFYAVMTKLIQQNPNLHGPLWELCAIFDEVTL